MCYGAFIIMSIYLKLALTGFVFFVAMYLLAYPTTFYAKWITKNCDGDYSTALLTSVVIGITPLVIIGLVYLWCEL